MLAFTNKIKFINVFIPEKIQLYINTFLKKEIDYFQKKYNFKIDFIPDPELVIPEYSIKLLNKNKKIVNIFENLNKIKEIERKLNFSSKAKNLNNAKVIKITKVKKLDKTKKNIEKIKNKQTRILWTRRKKKVKSNL